MRKIMIKAEHPGSAHLLAAMLLNLFPECEVRISLPGDDGLFQKAAPLNIVSLENEGVADGRNVNRG